MFYCESVCSIVFEPAYLVMKSESSFDAGPVRETVPGPISFAEFGSRGLRRVLSLASSTDSSSIMDEETINWRMFFTRIFLIILLCLVIVCLGLYNLNHAFLILAALICGFLILCLVATFVDLSWMWRWIPCCPARNPAASPTPTLGANISSGMSNKKEEDDVENRDGSKTSIETPVESPFGNYHNRL